MNNKHFFLILLFLSIEATDWFEQDDEEKIFYWIDITLGGADANFLTIDTNINNVTYTTPIDINSEFNWIRTSYKGNPPYQLKPKSLLPKKCAQQADSGVLIGRLEKMFSISNLTFNRISAEDNCDYQSSISLGIQYPNERNYSLMEGLRPYITRHFGFYFKARDHQSGKLTIGNLNGELFDTRKQVIYCETFLVYQKWNCYFTGIILGDIQADHKTEEGSINFIDKARENYYPLSTSVFFDTLHRFIICPKPFLQYLRNRYFSYYIDQTFECSYGVEDNEGITVISCQKHVITLLPLIHFVINRGLMTYKPDELFEEISSKPNMMRFKIIAKKDVDEWSFGLILFQKYNMMFDYAAKKVFLINQSENINSIRIIGEDKRKGSPLINSFFIIMIISGLSGILLILITLFKKKEFTTKLPRIK